MRVCHFGCTQSQPALNLLCLLRFFEVTAPMPANRQMPFWNSSALQGCRCPVASASERTTGSSLLDMEVIYDASVMLENQCTSCQSPQSAYLVSLVNLCSITHALGDCTLYIAVLVHRPVFSITDFMAKECAAFLL